MQELVVILLPGPFLGPNLILLVTVDRTLQRTICLLSPIRCLREISQNRGGMMPNMLGL